MRAINKIWQYYGLVRTSGEAADKVLELRYRHLKKNIPWLYAVLVLDAFSCVYAVTESSSIILRLILPVIITSAMLGRMLLWFLRRHEPFEAEKALKLLRSAAIFSAIIGSICALWSVFAWQWETSTFRYYIPAFLALGSFSTAYCLSLIPRSAILNLLIGILPISIMLCISGVMINIALAATMIACTIYLIGMIQRQYRQMIEMTDLQIEMHNMAHSDALTGLYNRRAFHEQLDDAVEQQKSEGGLTLALFDLDGFKQVNDRHGHLTGDKVLQIAAERLKHSIGDLGFVSRLGGDEFAVLFKGQPPIFCQQLIELTAQKLQIPAIVDGKEHRISASYGYSSVENEANAQAIALISVTDQKLYVMKKKIHAMRPAKTVNLI